MATVSAGKEVIFQVFVRVSELSIGEETGDIKTSRHEWTGL